VTTPVKLKKLINYPTGRKSKLHPNGIPLKYADKELLSRFKEMAGQPSVTRNKRALIAKFNPLHFAFGNTLPVWKTYQTYAQNMGLLETDYEQS
jgi:hypothetical protein